MQTNSHVLQSQPSTQARFSADELEWSKPFDRYLILKGPSGDTAVEAMVEDLEALERVRPREIIDPEKGEVAARTGRQRVRRKGDAIALRAAMSAVLANLYALSHLPSGREQFLAAGFANGDYPLTGKDRYRLSPITIKAMRDVRDYLNDRAFIDFADGFSKRDPRYALALGRVSRLRARAALVDRIEGMGVRLANVGASPNRELVILKGSSQRRGRAKPFLLYHDSDETRRWRSLLREVNRLLDQSVLAYSILDHDWRAQRLPAEDDDSLGSDFDDITAKAMYRVFNNGRWEHGGRLYGGFWEAAPKDVRKRITINGEAIVELDFAGLHPRLLYARERLTPPTDPYTVHLGGQAISRELGKVTFQRLLNGGGGGKLRPRPEDMKDIPTGFDFGSYVEALTEMHRPVAQYFGGCQGVELQRLDSDIAMGVLNDLCCGLQIPVLPVHDSFIIQSRFKKALETSMKANYQRCTGSSVEPIITASDDSH